MNAILILAIVVIALIVYIGYRISTEKRSKAIIKKIEDLYLKLNGIVIPLYDFKNCPKCGENVMNIRRLSPNGKSIEYSCEYCNKVITSKLIDGKNPQTALALIEVIKSNMEKLNELIGDKVFEKEIDISFTVNPTDHIKNDTNKRGIPESVRREVWKRDQGKCTKCGSNINLEFDHIIPVSKGGSNTARNIQLLCEKCNRSKSDKI